MELSITGTSDMTETEAPTVGGTESEAFGTRPRTNRPHSINLFGANGRSRRRAAMRALDLLVGVGIGAAAMYYFVRQR